MLGYVAKCHEYGIERDLGILSIRDKWIWTDSLPCDICLTS